MPKRIGLPFSGAGNLKGVLWMIAAGALFVGVTGVVRHLGSDMSPAQAAFIRYAFGVLLLLPVYWKLVANRVLPAHLGLHVLRGVVHAAGVGLWFYAMARIPIAEVTAIGFTTPIFLTLGAVVFLGERPEAGRVLAVLAGFLGTLVILRPGFEVIELGAIAQLVAAPLFACSILVAKRLTTVESSVAIVAYASVFITLALLPPAVALWRAPTPVELGWLFVTAVLATAGHYALTQALRAADVTVLQPFSFLQLVWAGLLGMVAFAEVPDPWTWAGGAIIVGAATYLARREATRGGGG